jgi:enamine deaminase RidA (YjgF/YER057c/UK114 family)
MSYFNDKTLSPFIQAKVLLQLMLEELSKQYKYVVRFLHCILVVKDMANFTEINRAFALFFNRAPPSRVCVENKLIHSPIEIELIVSVLPVYTLHVQSISEWAPACIGPYSQATVSSAVIRLAGQIGFLPATMQLTSSEQQAVQCLRNIHATLTAVNSCIQNVFRCVVFYDSNQMSTESAKSLEAVLSSVEASTSDEYVEANRVELPAKAFAIVPASFLPRGALVEFHVYALSQKDLSSIQGGAVAISNTNILAKWVLINESVLLVSMNSSKEEAIHLIIQVWSQVQQYVQSVTNAQFAACAASVRLFGKITFGEFCFFGALTMLDQFDEFSKTFPNVSVFPDVDHDTWSCEIEAFAELT